MVPSVNVPGWQPRLQIFVMALLTMATQLCWSNSACAQTDPQPQTVYDLTADSQRQPDVPQGKLEGPFNLASSVFLEPNASIGSMSRPNTMPRSPHAA